MSPNITQMINFFIENTQIHFEEEFSEVKAKEQIKIFAKSFNRIFEQNKYLMPDALTERHGINPVFVMALEETLKDEISSLEDFKGHVLKIYKYIMKSMLEMQTSRYKRSENKWELFLKETKKGNEQLYNNEYFDLKIIQEDATGYGFDLNRCLYFEIFKANGKEELGPILCEYDYILANNIQDWITFERTETIANGFSQCNFRFHPTAQAFLKSAVRIERPKPQIKLKCTECGIEQDANWQFSKNQSSKFDEVVKMPLHCEKEMIWVIQEPICFFVKRI